MRRTASSVDQPVADTPAVDYVTPHLGVELSPQPAGVGVKGSGLPERPVAPDVAKELLLGGCGFQRDSRFPSSLPPQDRSPLRKSGLRKT